MRNCYLLCPWRGDFTWECSCVDCVSPIFLVGLFLEWMPATSFLRVCCYPLNRECNDVVVSKSCTGCSMGHPFALCLSQPFWKALSAVLHSWTKFSPKARLSKIQGLRVIHTSSLIQCVFWTGSIVGGSHKCCFSPPRLLASQQCTLLMSGGQTPPPSSCLGGPPSKQGGLPGWGVTCVDLPPLYSSQRHWSHPDALSPSIIPC